MAVSRFDRPIESLAMSTYVPIDFDMLYKLGKELGDAVLRDREWFESSLDKFSKFRSLSAKDTETYYNETINRKDILQKIQEAVSNPDVMKDASWVAGLRSSMANTDYLLLADLQTSADNFLKHLAYLLKLALEDQYNPFWHNVDYASWDSRNNNIFTDVSPLPYKSIVKMVEPYVNNLKDSFIESDGRWDYFGVTPERTDEQLKAHWTDIYNTPYAKKHIEMLRSAGLSEKDANDEFARLVIQAGREFTTRNRNENPFALAKYKYNLLNPGGNTPTDKMHWLTLVTEADGSAMYLNAKNWVITQHPEYELLAKDAKSGDPEIRGAAYKRITELQSKTDTKAIFGKIISNFGSYNPTSGLTFTQEQADAAAAAVFDNVASNVSASNTEIKDVMAQSIRGVTKEQSTPLGRYRTIVGGLNLNLLTSTVFQLAGYQNADTVDRQAFNNALKLGKFSNMILMSNDLHITIPAVDINGNQRLTSIQRVTVAIPEDQVTDAGLTDAQMMSSGARILRTDDKVTETERANVSKKYDSDGEERVGKRSATGGTTTTVKPGKKYYVLDLSSVLPGTGEGGRSEYYDLAALKEMITNAGATDQYPYVLQDAYNKQ